MFAWEQWSKAANKYSLKCERAFVRYYVRNVKSHWQTLTNGIKGCGRLSIGNLIHFFRCDCAIKSLLCHAAFHASLKFRFAYDLEKVVAVWQKPSLSHILIHCSAPSLSHTHTEIGKTTATISVRNALDAIQLQIQMKPQFKRRRQNL